ncbi:MAG TPA: glycoside hydrolase family 18 protein, partial [Isosphaeraceae bacterium]|nr:glycoside hydrolase family 18 protein [Isosphaeraceae bacterium]
ARVGGGPRRALIPALFLALIAVPARAQHAAPLPPRVVGYYASWTDRAPRNYHVADIPAERLTHVNYAFALIDPEGRIVLDDPRSDGEDGILAGLRELKKKHPHLKALVSVGGWGGSARFSDVALTVASRRRFADSCVEFMANHDLDGVDIDWEFPVTGGARGNAKRPEDRANFTKLLATLRDALDAHTLIDRRTHLLTIAAPAGAPTSDHMELKAIGAILDWVNLMDYDFAGGWSRAAGFHAALAGDRGMTVEASVRHYVEAGVPRDKLVVGVPFYGKGWVVADTKDDGLNQPPAKNPPKGFSPGFDVAYRDIPAKLPGASRHWSAKAKAPYLFDPARKIFFGYDDPESLRLKAEYAREHNLGGLMIWELSQDDREGTLIRSFAPRRP